MNNLYWHIKKKKFNLKGANKMLRSVFFREFDSHAPPRYANIVEH